MSSNNAFGTFLETRDLLRRKQAPDVKRSGAPSSEEPLAQNALASVLQGEFPIAVSELLEKSGLPLTEFTETLERLKGAGLVEVNDENGRQIVDLTERGRTLRAA